MELTPYSEYTFSGAVKLSGRATAGTSVQANGSFGFIELNHFPEYGLTEYVNYHSGFGTSSSGAVVAPDGSFSSTKYGTMTWANNTDRTMYLVLQADWWATMGPSGD